MWSCKSCRQVHSDIRTTCPVTGQARTYAARMAVEPHHGHCASCDRGMHVQGRECPWCGESVCRRCYARHVNQCFVHVDDDYDDYHGL